MPEQLSMTAVLVVFYLVFAGQIFFLSLYYPAKLAHRIRYVLDKFPPEEYPRLYPSGHTVMASDASTRRLTLFQRYNQVVAVIGLMVLCGMLVSGYRPAPEGGDEIFVLLYLFLQIVPFMFIAYKEFSHYREMRAAFDAPRRSADLRPRRLFDFIAPGYVVLALVSFVGWVIFYLSDKGSIATWGPEVFVTLTFITGMNLAYIGVIARFLIGKKFDPYQAYKDQLKTIESTIKVLVFSSIGISFFLTFSDAADRYGLEVFDPPLASLYLQLCFVMGVGLTLRMSKIETIDFEVYRADAPAT